MSMPGCLAPADQPYHITVTVNGNYLTDRQPIDCPHIYTVVKISLCDLVRGLLHGGVDVEIAVQDGPAHNRNYVA